MRTINDVPQWKKDEFARQLALGVDINDIETDIDEPWEFEPQRATAETNAWLNNVAMTDDDRYDDTY